MIKNILYIIGFVGITFYVTLMAVIIEAHTINVDLGEFIAVWIFIGFISLIAIGVAIALPYKDDNEE